MRRRDAPAPGPYRRLRHRPPAASRACLPATAHRSGVAAPIHVDGRLWGALATATSRPERCTEDAPERLARFGELVGLAVANASEREALVARAATDPLTGLLEPPRVPRAARDGRRARRAPPAPLAASCCSTSTTSRTSTTRTGTRPATACWRSVAPPARPRRPRATCWRAWAATSSPGCCPTRRPRRAGRRPSGARGACVAAELRTTVGAVLTISAGVCDLDQADRAAELFRLADGALYWAKGHGRNTHVRYRRDVVEELSAAERAHRLERSQALATIRAPGPRGRRARPEHAAPLRARRRPRRAARGRPGLVAGGGRAAARRRPRARRRQDRHRRTRSCSSPAG